MPVIELLDRRLPPSIDYKSELENDAIAADRLGALLDNWVYLASQNETVACQSRYATIFGLTTFITGSAAILAHNGQIYPACFFSFYLIFCVLFLNFRFERQIKSWRWTLGILTKAQDRVIHHPERIAIDLRQIIVEACDFWVSDKPAPLTPHDIARLKRRRLRVRDMDAPSVVLLATALMALLFTAWIGADHYFDFSVSRSRHFPWPATTM